MSITINRRQGEQYKPQSESGGSDLLPNKPGFRASPFVLVHYPWSWEWHPEHGFIPSISKLNIKAATNGTRGDRGQKPNGRLAIAGTLDKGGMVFSVGDKRLGDWKNYLWSVGVDYGAGVGKHFIWSTDQAGEAFEKLPNGNALPKDTADHDGGWWDFVLWMRDESGALDPMPESTYNLLRNRQAQRVNHMIGRGRHQSLIEAAQAKLAAMDEQWAEMNAGQSGDPLSASAAMADDAMDLGPIPTPEKTKRKPGRPRKTTRKPPESS